MHGSLGRHLLVGWQLLYPPHPSLVGVVGSSPDPFRSTPAWDRYGARLKEAFPGLTDDAYVNLLAYDAVEPALEALKKVNGDLSDGERTFQATLASLRYHSPEGLITLDRHHQAIAPIYLGRVVMTPDGARVKQIAVIKHVHETLGGLFSSTTPPPSQTEPACENG
jgi:hypothetical protein